MKLFTLLGVGVLAVGLGCQSAVTPTAAPEKSEPTTELNKAVVTETTDDEAPRITLADAKAAFDAGEVVFVDTRSSQFYKNEHIKSALNVPSSDFDATYKSVPKDKKIIAYCS